MEIKPSRLIYQVAVGEVPDFYEPCIDSVREYADRIGADHHVQCRPKLRIFPLNSQRSENALRLGYLPIFEKENAFAWLEEYDQVAIMDADIFIRPEAPDIFEAAGDADFAGVLERDLPLTDPYREKVRKHSQGQFINLTTVDWQWNSDGAAYYNMGLMVLNRSIAKYLNGETPEQFIRRPEFERFVNGEGHWKWSTDQTLLNWWVKKSGMQTRDLDWRWNALYGAVRPETLKAAHFVHFFLSAKLPRKGAEIPGIIAGLE
jgi:hypothetical protein